MIFIQQQQQSNMISIEVVKRQKRYMIPQEMKNMLQNISLAKADHVKLTNEQH